MEEIVSSRVVGTWFGFYTGDEIKRMSVKRITNPIALDDLNLPLPGGLYDPALVRILFSYSRSSPAISTREIFLHVCSLCQARDR